MKQLRLNYGVFLLVGVLASCIHAQFRLDEISIMMKTVFDKQTELHSKSEETKEDEGIMTQKKENILLKEEETKNAIGRMENKTETLTQKEEETKNAIGRMENKTETLTQKEEDIGGTSTLADLHTSFKSDDSPAVFDGKVKQHGVDGPSQEEWVAIFKDLSIDNLPKLLEEKNYTLHANQTGVFNISVNNHSYEINFNWTSKIYLHYHVQGHQTNLSIVTVISVLVNDYYFAIGRFATKRVFGEEGKHEVFTTWSGTAESWFFTKNFNFDTYDLIGNSVTTEDGSLVVKNKKTAELLYHASYLQNTSNQFSLSFQDIKETMRIGKGLTHFIGSANQTTETLNVTQDVIGLKHTVLLDQILQSSSRPSEPITSGKFHGAFALEDNEYSAVSNSIASGFWGNVTASFNLKGYYCQDGEAPIKTEDQNPLNSLLKSLVILFS